MTPRRLAAQPRPDSRRVAAVCSSSPRASELRSAVLRWVLCSVCRQAEQQLQRRQLRMEGGAFSAAQLQILSALVQRFPDSGALTPQCPPASLTLDRSIDCRAHHGRAQSTPQPRPVAPRRRGRLNAHTPLFCTSFPFAHAFALADRKAVVRVLQQHHWNGGAAAAALIRENTA